MIVLIWGGGKKQCLSSKADQVFPLETTTVFGVDFRQQRGSDGGRG